VNLNHVRVDVAEMKMPLEATRGGRGEVIKRLYAHPTPKSPKTPTSVQVGVAEMKMPVEATGGLVVQTDTFHNPVFKESMKRVFARPEEPHHLGLASNATFEVLALAGAWLVTKSCVVVLEAE